MMSLLAETSWPEAVSAIAAMVLCGFIVWCIAKYG